MRKMLLACAAAMLMAGSARAAPVLMISIDGLRPLDVIDAPKRGLEVPNLRAIMANGTYARGVRNMLPTVTYPNHTTLITGVAPALHGISNNVAFDPFQKNMEGWYWYSSDIKVPTLWDAVHANHQVVASLSWPVSVGSPSIDYNVPEYWARADGGRREAHPCAGDRRALCRSSKRPLAPRWPRPSPRHRRRTMHARR